MAALCNGIICRGVENYGEMERSFLWVCSCGISYSGEWRRCVGWIRHKRIEWVVGRGVM